MADPFARNPAVDDVAEQSPAAYRAALTERPPPGLFPAGDLPAYTASGNAPRALLNLPWKLRHAAARADATEWARLFTEYASGIPDADVLAEWDPAADDPANREYLERVRAWAVGSPPTFVK